MVKSGKTKGVWLVYKGKTLIRNVDYTSSYDMLTGGKGKATAMFVGMGNFYTDDPGLIKKLSDKAASVQALIDQQQDAINLLEK